MFRIFLAVATVLAAVFALLIWRESPCEERVRGLQQTASASASVVRDELSSITGSIAAERVQKFLTEIDFNAAEYAAIQFCFSDCAILHACAKWQFWKPPSEACPNEYAQFNKRADEVIAMLERLANAERLAKEAVASAKKVAAAEEELAVVEAQSGSSGTAANLARLSLKQADEELERLLNQIMINFPEQGS